MRHFIFKLKHKISCICVSRYWNDFIRNTCLYQDLEFTGNDVNQFKKIVLFFHKNRHFGKQVKQLDADISKELDTYTMLTLPKLLPNLTMLKWRAHGWIPRNQLSMEQWEALDEFCLEAFQYWTKLEENRQFRFDGDEREPNLLN